MPRTPRSILALIVLTIALPLAFAARALAAPAAVWQSPAIIAPLPTGAPEYPSAQFAAVDGISCQTVGNCIAVGRYQDGNGRNFQSMLMTETDGTWQTPTELTLPTGAPTSAGGQDAELNALSCDAQADCDTVGFYTDASGNTDPMAAARTGGSWGQARALSQPSNSDSTDAELTSIACTSTGNCTAVGFYTDTSGNTDPMAIVETAGTWGQAIELTQPGDSAQSSAGLSGVDCTGVGECTAVGYYTDTNNNQVLMVDSETGGAWQAATEIPLPADAGAAQFQDASLNAVSCPSATSCVAGGEYDNADGTQAIAVAETAQGWGPVQVIQMPSDVADASGVFNHLDSITCSSPGNCVAGGAYTPASNINANIGLGVSETDGVWHQAIAVSPPADSVRATNQNEDFFAISCASPGFCEAAGTYRNATGNSNYSGLFANSIPQLSIDSTTLPGAQQGTPYQVAVGATGGVGSYTWSLSAGSLPAGLSLDPTTGVISGTPQATGTSDFTVSVADPGPPAQSVSQNLSITTQPPAAPPAGPTTTPTTPTGTGTGVTAVTLSGSAAQSGITADRTGSLVLPLVCPQTSQGCDASGTLALHLSQHTPHATGADDSAPIQDSILARFAGVEIDAGQSRLVAVRLSPSATRYLQTRHVHRVRVTLTLHNHLSGGPVVTTRQRVWLNIGRLTAGCPAAAGTLTTSAIGAMRLGLTRAQAHRLGRHRRAAYGFDRYCLTAGAIRVAYVTPSLAHIAAGRVHERVGDVDIALTANRHFTVRGVRTRERISAITGRLHLGAGLTIGANTWYFLPARRGAYVLKVQHGVVREIGVADAPLTRTRLGRRLLMRHL